MILCDSENPVNWVNFAASVGAALVSIAAILVGLRNSRETLESSDKNIKMTLEANKALNDKAIYSKRVEERKNEIYKSLNDFYEPLFQLRQKSSLLYDKLKAGKPSNTESDRFSTLRYLLEKRGPSELNPNDQVLLAEIIKIGERCENLIHDKAGLIDDETLRKDWFPRATKHFLVLRLAYKGELSGDTDLYSDSMFPSGIDDQIQRRITELRKELKDLNSN